MKPNDNDESNICVQSTPSRGALAICKKAAALIENVKVAVLSEFETGLEDYQQLLRLALNEADALAWQTDFPHLIFPVLAAEKAQTVADWQTRQKFLKRSRARLALAA
jgi:hypothetical protein